MDKSPRSVMLVGCGGTGAWVAHALAKMLDSADVLLLVDGDRIEEKNVDRQLYTLNDVGKAKADVLCDAVCFCHGNVEVCSEYYMGGNMADPYNLLICCADNNKCRRDVLKACDEYGCAAIICGNETISADAYFYKSLWGGGCYDPRVYMPELLNDPPRPELSCTATAVVEEHPQTVMANLTSAAFAVYLYDYWMNRNNTNKKPYLIRSDRKGIETLYMEE